MLVLNALLHHSTDLVQRGAKNSVCRLLKMIQRRGARRSMSGGVLFLYVDAKSVERNEAYESFSAVCLEGDDRSDAFALVHKIEGLVNSLQRKPVRDHRINLDLAA